MNTTRTLIAAFALAAGTAVSMAPAQAMNHPPKLADIGTAVATGSANRTIVVDAQTRWINVTNGETVRFDVNGRQFTFAFDAWNNINSVDLSAIAPGDVMAPMVRVYIAPNPLSQG
jgi:hypothetical protein